MRFHRSHKAQAGLVKEVSQILTKYHRSHQAETGLIKHKVFVKEVSKILIKQK